MNIWYCKSIASAVKELNKRNKSLSIVDKKPRKSCCKSRGIARLSSGMATKKASNCETTIHKHTIINQTLQGNGLTWSTS